MSRETLPHQATSFIGRTDELRDIATQLADPACRLLTLVGPGGIGKTRLAIQAAEEQQPHVAHGVHFVPLTPVASPDQLVPALATALKITLFASENPLVQIERYLSEKHILLLMDNFEHLLDGVDLLSNLLQAAPGLKILATSREKLSMQEEWVLILDGLSFPAQPSPDSLENFSAVQLFVQRARQVKAHFSLAENGDAVQTICRQVEGMPLGLELVATWLRALSCQQIVTQMNASLDFLTTPLRNVLERHRSMRAVFDQSWKLLSAGEQTVWMKLSVFRGGFDLECAQQVAGASLSLLAGLVDKSLIRLNPNERYDLHELLRQYAADKLREAGLQTITDHQHFDYFFHLAEQADAHNFGREQIAWYDRLEVEFDNLRAALSWSLHDQQDDRGLRMGSALGWFFSERSHWVEGLYWFERLLPAYPDAPLSVRAKALHNAGALAGVIGDMQRNIQLCEEALALARAANDRWNIAWALSQRSQLVSGEQDQSIARLEESLALFRELNDPMGITHTLVRRSWRALFGNDYPTMRLLLKEAEKLAREAGDKIMLGWINTDMGRAAFRFDHDLQQAKVYLESGLSLFREAHFQIGINISLLGLSEIELELGDLASAQRLNIEALFALRNSAIDHHYQFLVMTNLASVARAAGQLRRAAILLAVAPQTSSLLESTTTLITSYEDDLASVRAELGEPAFSEAWAIGKAMTQEQAVAYAQEGIIADLSTPPTNLLTRREIEILGLVASGLSNGEIAQHLHFTVSTVKWYLSEIYSKLGVHGRAKAVAHAREKGLLS